MENKKNESISFDPRFFQAAMDGLKAYTLKEFTIRFLKKHGIPVQGNLININMWKSIENWMGQDSDRCKTLLNYVDELRLWGRQRIFLYDIGQDTVEALSDKYALKKNLDKSIKTRFKWKADKPFIAGIKYTKTIVDKDPILIFKIIKNRKYNLKRDGLNKILEERSTNFFIVNLRNRHAEIRVQELQTGAVENMNTERNLIKTTIEKYLNLDSLEPIRLVPVMKVMQRTSIYPIKTLKLKFTKKETEPNPIRLVEFLNNLFKKSQPVAITAFWDCNQEYLGQRHFNFMLSRNNFIEIDGLVDPKRINKLLLRLVDMNRNPKEYLGKVIEDGTPEPNPKPKPSIPKRGIVSDHLEYLHEHPKAQAALLSSGAIAASFLWVILESIGNRLLDEAYYLLGEFTVEIFTTLIDLVWLIIFYGWNRIWSGMKVLVSLRKREVWVAIKDARKRAKENKELALQ